VINDCSSYLISRCQLLPQVNALGVQMSYPIAMDHLEVLREKIGNLRTEIAHIQELNAQYRLRHGNVTEAQVAHGQRHERLEAIQQELAQLAALGRKVLSVEEMREKHRSRLHPVKQAS
jgi:hypothetical protein